MNPLIETANHLGEQFLYFAWPMFWQSSLLIAVLFALDFALRRQLRAAVRYALWLIVVVKLLLPPTLALPTGIAWWTNRPTPVKLEPRKTAIVTYDQTMPAEAPQPMPTLAQVSPPPSVLTPAGWFIVGSSATMLLLLAWLVVSWRKIARTIRTAGVGSMAMEAALFEVKCSLDLRLNVRLRMTPDAMSPAVCGLFRPTVLMPQVLAERLSPDQLRAVLLHELVHLRRGDVWVNCVQTLLQIAYWWHPLLWLANARIRRVREEAVDDAVMLALCDGAETYAPTLLEVAKVAISRPLAGLRMVGILESRGALRQRIERLVNFRAPRHAGLTLVSVFGILAFTALAVPMGEGPARLAKQPSVSQSGTNSWPDAHFSGYEDIDLQPRFFIVDESRLHAVLPGMTPGRPLGIPLDKLAALQRQLDEAGAVTYNSVEPQGFQVFSGGHYHIKIGGCTNGIVNYNLEQSGANTRVLGADYQSPATQPGWSQMDLFWTPWKEQGTVRSEMKLAFDGNTNVTHDAETTIPLNSAMIWMVKSVSNPGKCQIVLLQPGPANKTASITPIPKAGQTDAEFASNPLNDRIQTNINWTKKALFKADRTASRAGFAAQKSSGRASAGRSNMEDKLEAIHLPNASFDNVPLGKVLLGLYQDSRQYDPDKLGINFVADDEITNALILVHPEMNDISLRKILDTVVNGSAIPIHYSIQDYGVVFSAGTASESLQIHSFQADPNVLAKNLHIQLETNATKRATTLYLALRESFQKAGVDLKKPKSFMYNDRNGVLIIRATQQDLDAIERVLQQLNFTPPLVNIKTTFIEVPDALAKLLLKNISTVSNGMPAASYSALLLPGQAKQFRERCESESNVKILAGPEVTTLSGRQAMVEQVEVMTLVKGIKPEALTPPGLTNDMFYQTERLDLGPIIDLVPRVMADEYTIQLSARPHVTEFLGYDGQTNTSTFRVYVNGKKESVGLAVPRPHLRTRSMAANATLLDGQTLLLGGAPWVESITKADGTVEKKTTADPFKKQLFVLVTPTLIDPAGNRLHSSEETKKFSDAKLLFR